MMSFSRSCSNLVLCSFLLGGIAGTALAEPLTADPLTGSTTPATEGEAQEDDDAAMLQLAEPEYRLINLPTTLRLARYKSNFDLTHRFAGNLRRGSFADQASRLFGIDEGAIVGIEYRIGVAPRTQAVFYRSSVARTIQLSAKIDALHQRTGAPLSASAVVSVEGTDNLQEQYAPAIAVSLSRTFGDALAVYLVPTWVHNSAAAAGFNDHTAFVGAGARLRIRDTVYLAAEVSPRISGYAPGKPQYGFAIEKRAGGHMFQLNFTNGNGTTLAQVARGGQPESLAMGFNLARKFF
jgi:hypothetical protein